MNKSLNLGMMELMTAIAAGAGLHRDILEFHPEPQYRGPTPVRRKVGKKAGDYGRGITNAGNRKRREALPKVGVLRDAHGAYTLIGRPPGYGVIDTSNLKHEGRRVWLAGVSAQRGY